MSEKTSAIGNNETRETATTSEEASASEIQNAADESSVCQFRGPNEERCKDLVYQDGFCLWHLEQKKKEVPELGHMLEARAKTGEPMIGFSLRGTDLTHINLVNYGSHDGYLLTHADLYRADLSGAHLFSLNLTGTSLMKANLTKANLHRANLTNTNLLGTNFDGTRLDNVEWGGLILQEHQANAATTKAQRLDYWEQAEEIYRNLRKSTEMAGLFENAGHFFQREMVMRRYQMPLWSLQRFFSKMVDLFCGYGERPARVIAFSMMAIFGFATAYWVFGIAQGEIGFQLGAGFERNLEHYLSCAYFSVVTFTTLGYGDLTPHGISRAIAAVEAFIGSFTLALFVVVFVKKMTR
jgi:uncharacterized protein YjbI with pentapeptide repeats